MLLLGLPGSRQTVQAILRPRRGVPGGPALEKADDFVDRGLLVLVGPSAFERKPKVNFFLCEMPRASSAHVSQAAVPLPAPQLPGSTPFPLGECRNTECHSKTPSPWGTQSRRAAGSSGSSCLGDWGPRTGVLHLAVGWQLRDPEQNRGGDLCSLVPRSI